MVHQEEGEGLCSRLKCHAHLHLSVNGMKTGHSKDIHGEVRRLVVDVITDCCSEVTSLIKCVCVLVCAGEGRVAGPMSHTNHISLLKTGSV